MKKTIQILLSGILLIILLLSCSEDTTTTDCPQDESYCDLIKDNKLQETGSIIDDYLLTQVGNTSAESLENLKMWLSCKACVESTTIICDSCIETYPEQSELSVKLIQNGTTISYVLDITMSDTLRFHRYHE